MRTRLSALALLALLLVAGRADAGSFTFKPGGVTVEIPKGWTTDDQGDYVTIGTKDKTFVVSLMFAGNVSADDAWSATLGQAQGIVDGLSVDKQAGVLGNLNGYVGAGAGTMSGNNVTCMIATFSTDTGALALFALGVVGKYEKHEKPMIAFLGSLARVVKSGALVEDKAFGILETDAQKFALKVVAALEKKDGGKSFVKLVSKKGLTFSDNGEIVATAKAAKLKTLIKKAGSVGAYVGLAAAGDYYIAVQDDEISSFSIYRGTQSGVVTYLHASKVKGKWTVDNVWMQDHGADDGDL